MFKGFNYGLSSQPSSTQYNENVSDDHNMNISKTTTHLDEPSDTYINTGNIISDYTQTFAQDADISTISITTNKVYEASNYAHTLLTTEPVSTENTGKFVTHRHSINESSIYIKSLHLFLILVMLNIQ